MTIPPTHFMILFAGKQYKEQPGFVAELGTCIQSAHTKRRSNLPCLIPGIAIRGEAS